MAYRNGGVRTLDNRGEACKAIHAELARSDHATACGIVARSSSPVLKLCRMLVDAGHDPATPLEAWRDSTLCLRVRSIDEGARLRIRGNGVGFEIAAEETRPGASPVRLQDEDGAVSLIAAPAKVLLSSVRA